MPNLTPCVDGYFKGTTDGESIKVIHTKFGDLKEMTVSDVKKWKRGNSYTTFFASDGISCDIKPSNGITFKFGNFEQKKLTSWSGFTDTQYTIYDINGSEPQIGRLFDDIIFWVAKL
jgi:hypothetical protein